MPKKHWSRRIGQTTMLVAGSVAAVVLMVGPVNAGQPDTPADSTSDMTGNILPNPAVPASESAMTPGDEVGDGIWSVAADVTVASRYLFQGFDYSDGKPVVQPNVALGFGRLAVTIWGNYDASLQHFNELDFSATWTWSHDALTVTGGYMSLVYPNRPDWDPSQEFLVDAAIDGPFSPSISWHYDFDAGQGSYAAAGVSHEIGPLATLGATLYYQDHYYGLSGFPALELSAGRSMPVGSITISPSLSRIVTWANGDFRDGAGPEDNWLLSLNISREF